MSLFIGGRKYFEHFIGFVHPLLLYSRRRIPLLVTIRVIRALATINKQIGGSLFIPGDPVQILLDLSLVKRCRRHKQVPPGRCRCCVRAERRYLCPAERRQFAPIVHLASSAVSELDSTTVQSSWGRGRVDGGGGYLTLTCV